jgi:hypothetical protein
MDSLDLFFKKYAYKFPKGYPDLNDEQDINLLADLLENLGINLNEVTKSYSEIINTILNSPEAKGKLEKHSRPQRIKNIANISNNDFIDIISNVFDIDTGNIKTLPPKIEGNPSSKNFAFKFPIEGQEITIILGTETRGKEIEDYELNNLNNIISENGGSINILVGDNLYSNITKVNKIPGNKQADFEFIGDKNLYIQHKDLKASQQYSGIFSIKDDPEVQDFVKKVNELSNGVLQSKQNYKRPIKNDELKLLAAYGRGSDFGPDKVYLICFGNITLSKESDTFTITSPVQFIYPEVPSDDYEPYMYVTFRTGMNQQNIKNARFGFYPKKYYPSAQEI